MRARISRTPDYRNRSEKDKDKITAGIWHGYPEETKRRIAKREEKTMDKETLKMALQSIMKACRDFGGWTSHNADWERGAREGERKTEDRQRGIQVQRDREAQFQKKAQEQHVAFASNPKNPVQQEQRGERQEALRYRAGQRKEQHQGLGKVPAGPREHRPFKPISTTPVEKSFDLTRLEKPPGLTPRSVLFIPTLHVKSIAEDVKGNVFVEGTVSMPIKDLQGDLLEVPALVQAKNAMVTPPNDLVWLDHYSPYARPEAGAEAPIGRFVKSAIIQAAKGQPSLWAKMIMNKAHPQFKETLYELKNKFRNAFSMEFVPVREGLKMVQGKIVNSISEIKYFATSLVRAPANEGATISKVYVKAFANSLQFCPVRVKGLGWIGQTVMEKQTSMERKETEPEAEPEDEPEEEPEEEPEPLETRDFDRQTGSTAAERHSTAMGEWGDPALDKARATLKASPMQRLDTLEKMMAIIGKNMALMGKSLGINMDFKGIDEDTTEVLGEEEGPGIDDEQQPGEVKHGKMGAPKKQRVITTFDGPDLPGEEVEGQDISTKSLLRFIRKSVNGAVAQAIDRKTVFRKDSFNEEAAPKTKSAQRMQMLEKDDGSIESQLAIVDEYSR